MSVSADVWITVQLNVYTKQISSFISEFSLRSLYTTVFSYSVCELSAWNAAFAYTASLLGFAPDESYNVFSTSVTPLSWRCACWWSGGTRTVLRTGCIPRHIVQYMGSFTGSNHLVDTGSRGCKTCTPSYRVIVVYSAIGCSSWRSRRNRTVRSSLTAGCWWAVSDRLQVVDVLGRWCSRPWCRLGKTAAAFSSTTCHRSRQWRILPFYRICFVTFAVLHHLVQFSVIFLNKTLI